MTINLRKITQGERGTLTFTWEFPENLTSPASISGATITATMTDEDGLTTAVSGTLTSTAATTCTWALSAGDSGTAGTFTVLFAAVVTGVTTYTLEATLEVIANPAVTGTQNDPLVSISAANAAWVTVGVAGGALGDAAYEDTTAFDAAGAGTAAVSAALVSEAVALAGGQSTGYASPLLLTSRAKSEGFVSAEWFADDIQAALDGAASDGIATVKLNPTKTYNIADTINVPAETTLDGGGSNATSAGVTAVNHLAKINATGAMGAMVSLADFAGIQGCWLDGNALATIGIQAVNLAGIVIAPRIERNFIQYVATGIKLGGATYASIKNNSMNIISAIGLDALAAYGGTYYGGNQCHLEMNEYKGTTNHVRLEGIFISFADDFEGTPTTASIELAGTNVSRLSLYSPYVEAAKVFLKNSVSGSNVYIYGGFIDGTSLSGSEFCQFTQPLTVFEMYGASVQQFVTMFTGTIPTGAFRIPRSNAFQTYTTFGLSAMTLYSIGYARGMAVETTNELAYAGDEKEWTSATVANFDCMLAKFHRMNLTSPASINVSTAATKLIRGHKFSIQFDGNTTLSYHASTTNKYRLQKAANCTPPAGTVIDFVTDSGNGGREIGDFTARL